MAFGFKLLIDIHLKSCHSFLIYLCICDFLGKIDRRVQSFHRACRIYIYNLQETQASKENRQSDIINMTFERRFTVKCQLYLVSSSTNFSFWSPLCFIVSLQWYLVRYVQITLSMHILHVYPHVCMSNFNSRCNGDIRYTVSKRK